MNNVPVDLLLVEDRAEDAELALMALEEHNLTNHIKWVKDGQEALDYLFAENEYKGRDSFYTPKMILLDLHMPKLSGIEVLKKIRTSNLTKTIPVVVLTTSRAEQNRVEAYNYGVNSYIVKPVEFENFSKSVKDIGYYWLLLNEPKYSSRD